MNRGLRHRLALLLLVGSCIGLPACGGGDNGESQEVIGDSPEGIAVDDGDNAGDLAATSEAFPQGPAGVESDEIGEEENTTDGQ